MNNTLNKSIIQHINQYYSDYACMLSGSYIDGSYNEYSDIDILIFTKDNNLVYNEMINIDNIKYQLIVIPVQKIGSILQNDFNTNTGVYLSMISKGVIIKDSEKKFLEALQEHVRELMSVGPKKMQEEELYFIKARITSLLYDVLGCKNKKELFFTIIELVDKLTTLKLLSSGNWCGQVKHKYYNLKKNDDIFLNELEQANKQYYINESTEALIKLTKEVLNQNGGVLPFYSQAKILTKTSYDYLVFEIGIKKSSNKNKEELYQITKKIKSYIDSQTDNKGNYFYYSNNSLSKSGIVIQFVIHASQSYINDFIIFRLNNILKIDSQSSIFVNLPIRFDPISTFFSMEIYYKLIPLFSHISDICLLTNKLDYNNKESQLHEILFFFKKIRELWFNNKKDVFIEFLKYLNDCWLPYSYDDNYKLGELKIVKEKILKNYTISYNQNKDILIKYYKMNVNYNEMDINNYLLRVAEISEIDCIPEYKTYFIKEDFHKYRKEWVLFKEVISKVLDILFVDEGLKGYITYVIIKIEEND